MPIKINGVLDGLTKTTASGWVNVTGQESHSEEKPLITVSVLGKVVAEGLAIKSRPDIETLGGLAFGFSLTLKTEITDLQSESDLIISASYLGAQAVLSIYNPVLLSFKLVSKDGITKTINDAPNLDELGLTLPVINELKQSGCSLPDIAGLSWQKIGDLSKNNWLACDSSNSLSTIKVIIHPSASNNLIILGSACKLKGEINVIGSHNVLTYGESSCNLGMLNVFLQGNSILIGVGKNSNFISTSLFARGDNTSIVIGDDCLFSHSITLRNNDDHGIIDLATKEWINQPGNITIQPHVWICPQSTILKNVTIGAGSIIATASLVTRSVPKCCLSGGIPAKVIRQNVSWDHSLIPNIDRVLTSISNYSAWE